MKYVSGRLLALVAALAAFGSVIAEDAQPTPSESPTATPVPPVAPAASAQPAAKAPAPAPAPAPATTDATAAKGDPKKPAAAGSGATPQHFEPSEKVRADFDVSFPVDI